MDTTNRLLARCRRDGIEPFTARDVSLEIDRLTVRSEAAAEMIRLLAAAVCLLLAMVKSQEEEANALRWRLGEVKDEAFDAAEKSNIEFWESIQDDATTV